MDHRSGAGYTSLLLRSVSCEFGCCSQAVVPSLLVAVPSLLVPKLGVRISCEFGYPGETRLGVLLPCWELASKKLLAIWCVPRLVPKLVGM